MFVPTVKVFAAYPQHAHSTVSWHVQTYQPPIRVFEQLGPFQGVIVIGEVRRIGLESRFIFQVGLDVNANVGNTLHLFSSLFGVMAMFNAGATEYPVI